MPGTQKRARVQYDDVTANTIRRTDAILKEVISISQPWTTRFRWNLVRGCTFV